jgi:hypothetical protein
MPTEDSARNVRSALMLARSALNMYNLVPDGMITFFEVRRILFEVRRIDGYLQHVLIMFAQSIRDQSVSTTIYNTPLTKLNILERADQIYVSKIVNSCVQK